MKFFDYFKYELKGWKKIELVTLLIVAMILLYNCFFLQDSKIAVASAVCGIMYSMLAGKGKASCYIFGLCGTAFYSYLSFKNALFGNLALYVFYYLPIQIYGFFVWNKNLKTSTREIIKKELSLKEKFGYGITSVLFCVVAILLIKYLNGSSPYFDGITTVLSIYGLLFTVKRCIEQWLIWMVVNGLSSIMWLNLIINGAKAYSTLLMWIVYFILSIYFYITWKEELASYNIQDKKNELV